MKVSAMKMAKVCMDVVVYILMIVNLKYLTSKYLMYQCDTNCAPYFPVILHTPRLSLCFDLIEVARLAGNQVTWFNVNMSSTFNDWLAWMPEGASLMKSCSYRNSTLDLMVEMKSSIRCSQLIEVTRYRMQGYLCYKFEIYEPAEYSYHYIINTMYDPRQLFRVQLSGPITQLKTFFPVLHLSSYPDIERILERPRYKKENALFHLSYGIYQSHGMPAPYESNCFDWTPPSCFQQCMDMFLEPHDLVSDSGLVVEESMDSYRKLMQRGSPLEKQVQEMHGTCYKRCKFNSCSQSIVATSVSPPYGSGEDLNLVVESIARPVAKIQQIPGYLFGDYATQACSLISIWIGINFTSILDVFKRKHSETVQVSNQVNSLLQTVGKSLKVLRSSSLTEVRGRRGVNSKRKRRNRKIRFLLLDGIISALVFSAFSVQLINVLTNYFEYDTTIRFHRDTNVRLQIPSVSICLSYNNALGFKLPLQVTEQNYEEYFALIDSKLNKSLSSLFKEIHSDGVIDGCHTRNWTDRMKQFIHLDRQQCLQHFKVSQFFMNQHFCYQIESKQPLLDVYQADVSSLFIKPSTILTFDLGEGLSFDVAQVYLVLGEGLPGWDNEPSTITKSERKREITISTRLFISNLLEPPYNTRCSSVGRTECHSRCLDDYMEQNILPYLATEEDDDFTGNIMSYRDLAKEAFYREWKKIEKMCEERCDREMCQYNFTVAKSSGEWPVEDDKFKLSIESPSSATSLMDTNPVMGFFDLLYQVMCSLSFWLGFSVLAANPLTIIVHRRMDCIERSSTKKFLLLKRMLKRLIDSPVSRDQMVSGLSRPSLSTAVSCLVYLVAGVCCLAHLAYQMEIYLRHATYIDVSQDVESSTDYSFFLCLDHAEMLARDRGLDMFNLSMDERTKLLDRPVEEIFAASPPKSSIIKGCSHRGLSSRRGKVHAMENVTDKILFHTSNISECYEHYAVKRMIVGSLMCYSLAPKNFTLWTRIGQRGVLNEPTTLYTITVNSSLLTARFSFLTGVHNYFPITSSEFLPNLLKDAKYNHYIISYIKYISSFLPTEYPNHDFNPFMFDRCVGSCIQKAFDGTNRTFSSRFRDPDTQSRVKFLTQTDHKVNRTGEKLKRVIAACDRGCTYYNVFTKPSQGLNSFPITITLVGSSTVKPLLEQGLTLLSLKTTPIMVFSITYNIRISLFEQLINLGSIVSIWFGFSAISLANVRKLKDRKITFQDLAEVDEHLMLIRRIYQRA